MLHKLFFFSLNFHFASHACCSTCRRWTNRRVVWERKGICKCPRRPVLSDLQVLQCGRQKKTLWRIVLLRSVYGRSGKRRVRRRRFKQSKETNHAKYTLVFVTCKDGEKKITARLDALDGRACRRCYPDTWRHKLTCAFVWATKLRVSEKDLSWLQNF